jgi:hypothetical protein
MLRVLYPTYTLKIEIKDIPPSAQMQGAVAMVMRPDGYMGNDCQNKYFNSVTGKTGCDEVLAAVKDALAKAGIQATLSFEKFEHS